MKCIIVRHFEKSFFQQSASIKRANISSRHHIGCQETSKVVGIHYLGKNSYNLVVFVSHLQTEEKYKIFFVLRVTLLLLMQYFLKPKKL